jgi:UDP-glucose 4-epimerase
MKCLVTGGAGFIGSHLVELLLENGAEVRVLDNFFTGKRENLQGLAVQIIEGDIRDVDHVWSAVQGVDTVFHLAALCSVGTSIKIPVTTHNVNVTGTLVLLDACRKAGVHRVVFSSSSSVYGDSQTLPKREDMKPAPISPYAVSKLIGEHYCQMFWRVYGLETVCLRYFNVFGPRQDPASEYAAVIPRFIHAVLHGEKATIYGDGTQTRDFTYAEDVARANLLVATNPQVAGEVINIACGERRSLLDLLGSLGEILGSNLVLDFRSPRPADVKHSQASITRAQCLLGYSPRVKFEEGLERTIEWFCGSRDLVESGRDAQPRRRGNVPDAP